MFSLRQILFVGSFGCVVLMGVALYFQHVMGLEPCPLCIFQRVAIIATGLVLLVAALHNPGPLLRRLYGLLIILTAGAGLGVAARQVWLQHLPKDQLPSCGPGLDYMVEVLPFSEMLATVLKGSGECAEVKWTFLTLSIPEWMLMVFGSYILLGLYLMVTRRYGSPR